VFADLAVCIDFTVYAHKTAVNGKAIMHTPNIDIDVYGYGYA